MTTAPLLVVKDLSSWAISMSAQPTMQHLPQPRATSAACEVMPPLLVRMAWALCMPSTSSGEVSSRTRMTFSPRAAHSTASLEVKTARPLAPPGPAGRPLAIGVGRQLGLRVDHRQQELDELVRRDAHDGGRGVDQLLLLHLDGHAHRGHAVALADAALEHEQAALLDRELDVLHVLVVLLEPPLDSRRAPCRGSA